MLELRLVGKEGFNQATQEFIELDVKVVQLEHSLVSLSKWESKFEKPFLNVDVKPTAEEMLSYLLDMMVTPNVTRNDLELLTADQINLVDQYINSKQTATVINDKAGGKAGAKKIVTSELIYYWMISYQIPFECQYWHLNRLIMLIRICQAKAEEEQAKNKPKRRLTNSDKQRMAQERTALNAKRLAELGTTG